jgi:hypothetical protein
VSVIVRNWLQQHMRTVRRKKSFSCSFKNTGNFSVVLCNLSLRNLTGEEPCSCFHFSKFFAQLYALNYHLETQFEKRTCWCFFCIAICGLIALLVLTFKNQLCQFSHLFICKSFLKNLSIYSINDCIAKDF